MKKTRFTFCRLMAAAVLPAMMLMSCSDEDNTVKNPEEGDDDDTEQVSPVETAGRFVLATTVTGSNASSYLLVTSETLDEGTRDVTGGLLNEGATQWVYYKNYIYALSYNQGEAGTTRSYFLNSGLKPEERGIQYKITRFSSYGTYDNDIITMSTGSGNAAFADSKGYLPQTLLVTYLNVENQTMTSNDISTNAYSMENYLGNGEYVTLSGAEQVGSRIFCGAVPMGLSQYGVTDGNGKWIRPGFEHLVHDTSGGTGSGAYNADELSGTQYPDECWVAIYNNSSFLNPTLAKTDKISTPCGRYRSQYYQTVWADDNEDVYVFSASYAKTQTDPLQQTTLPAGVCRIPKGKSEFDDYYCNIESLADGCTFMRCWPAGGSNFILIMYDRPITEKGFAATKLAIFNAQTKSFNYVTNLPEDLTSFGKSVYVKDNYVYIAVNVENDYPAIYRVDTATAVAEKGLTVLANEINGFDYVESVQ